MNVMAPLPLLYRRPEARSYGGEAVSIRGGAPSWLAAIHQASPEYPEKPELDQLTRRTTMPSSLIRNEPSGCGSAM